MMKGIEIGVGIVLAVMFLPTILALGYAVLISLFGNEYDPHKTDNPFVKRGPGWK